MQYYVKSTLIFHLIVISAIQGSRSKSMVPAATAPKQDIVSASSSSSSSSFARRATKDRSSSANVSAMSALQPSSRGRAAFYRVKGATASSSSSSASLSINALPSYALEHNKVVMWEPFGEIKGDAVSAAFNFKNNLIAIGSTDATAQIWDIDADQLIHRKTLVGHTKWVRSVDFAPSGDLVATASDEGTAVIWDIETNKRPIILPHKTVVSSALFNPRLPLLLTIADRIAYIWETGQGTWIREIPGYKGNMIRELAGHTRRITAATWSPDGELVATASADNTARIWYPRDNKLLHILRHKEPVNSVVFSPDGRYVLTASNDKTARIWDAKTGKSVRGLPGHTGPIISALFSPDGNSIVTASYDGTARIWHLKSNTVDILTGHTGPLNSAVFSHNGKYILTTSDDKTARIWEVDTGQQLYQLLGHTGPLHVGIFNFDDTFIITVSDDAAVQVWREKTLFALTPDEITQLLRISDIQEKREYIEALNKQRQSTKPPASKTTSIAPRAQESSSSSSSLSSSSSAGGKNESTKDEPNLAAQNTLDQFSREFESLTHKPDPARALLLKMQLQQFAKTNEQNLNDDQKEILNIFLEEIGRYTQPQ